MTQPKDLNLDDSNLKQSVREGLASTAPSEIIDYDSGGPNDGGRDIALEELDKDREVQPLDREAAIKKRNAQRGNEASYPRPTQK